MADRFGTRRVFASATDFMLSGATWSAAAMVGTAVLRIVVSSDSIKNATAISHGTKRLLEAVSEGYEEGASIGLGCIGLCALVH